jgi:hypothetical protein
LAVSGGQAMTELEKIYQPAIDALEQEAVNLRRQAYELELAIKRLRWHAGLLKDEPNV